MDKAEVKFKPTAFHKESVAHEKLKKEAFRTVRVDSDVVMKEIFQAFEVCERLFSFIATIINHF